MRAEASAGRGGPRRLVAGVGGPDGHHLIERLVARDHAEVAAGALLEGVHAGLEVAHLGGQLPIALGELIVLGMLGADRAS